MSKATRKKVERIVQESATRKQYSYSLKGVTLNFTLRQDNKSELKPFKKLLERALEDVTKDLL